MLEFSFGSDPEFMLIDNSGNYKSAIGIIPGTKEDKLSLGNEHYAFYDNVLCEVNIKPSYTKQETLNNFKDCFKRLSKVLGNYKVKIQASQKYDLSECNHIDAMIFGCDPEYSIYNLNENGVLSRLEPPIAEPGNTFRSAGGHIHIGHEICLNQPIEVVQFLDIFIGIPSLMIDHDETSSERRKIYGGAGTHRFNMNYGIEYRSLSNFWLCSPKYVELIYDLTSFVLEIISNDYFESINYNKNEIKNIIHFGNKETAKTMFKKYKKYLPSKLNKKIVELSSYQNYDFYREWCLYE